MLFGARERTERKFRTLLQGAGFEVQRLVMTALPAASASSEATPPGTCCMYARCVHPAAEGSETGFLRRNSAAEVDGAGVEAAVLADEWVHVRPDASG